MSEGETKLPLEIGGVDKHSAHAHIGTTVGERAFVGPLSLEAGDVTDGATRQEIIGLGIEDFGSEREAVVEHVERQGHIETIGGFPLDLRILNVGQLECCGALQELHIAEVGTCGVVIHIVIAGDFETRSKFCVIDCAHLEPILIGEHPTGLHRGEESPFHARYLDSAVGFATKTRGAFCTSTELEEVAVHVVIIRIGIVAEVDPTVVDTTFADVLQRIADIGHFVVVVVVTTRVAVRIRIGGKTETTEDIKLMLAVVALPIDAEIVEECGFLTKLRSSNALHIAETFD